MSSMVLRIVAGKVTITKLLCCQQVIEKILTYANIIGLEQTKEETKHENAEEKGIDGLEVDLASRSQTFIERTRSFHFCVLLTK